MCTPLLYPQCSHGSSICKFEEMPVIINTNTKRSWACFLARSLNLLVSRFLHFSHLIISCLFAIIKTAMTKATFSMFSSTGYLVIKHAPMRMLWIPIRLKITLIRTCKRGFGVLFCHGTGECIFKGCSSPQMFELKTEVTVAKGPAKYNSSCGNFRHIHCACKKSGKPGQLCDVRYYTRSVLVP